MYPHHEESIQNLIKYFKDQDGVTAIILGGSIAKGREQPDSDIDAMIIVTPERYRKLEEQHLVSECIFGHCTYEGGYFDIKYYDKSFLKLVSEQGSEPARSAFTGSRCLYTSDQEIPALLASIAAYPIALKEEKMLSFYSAVTLYNGYFWHLATHKYSEDNDYFKVRTATEIVLFCFRLLLADAEVLYPCQRDLCRTVNDLPKKPARIVEKSKLFLRTLNDESRKDFVDSVLNFIQYKPPKDYEIQLSRFVDDNELWWYKHRPMIAEW